MLGDQFTLFALPWLVIELSRDPLALAAVFALSSLPRVLLLPLIGPLVDGRAPDRILLWSKAVNTVLLCALAFAVAGGQPPLSLIYLLALCMGICGAFAVPCSAALLPQVVARDNLLAANKTIMALSQAALLAGPLAAGAIVALCARTPAAPVSSKTGLFWVFAFDAISFAVSALAVSRLKNVRQAPSPQAGQQGLWHAAARLWSDRELRTCVVYWIACIACLGGPIQVGLPVLASEAHGFGPAAYGTMLAAQGAGALGGMLLSGVGASPAVSFGTRLLLIDAAIAVFVVLLGLAGSAWQMAALLFVIGALNGTVQVKIFTWAQLRTPPDMLGRASSLFMLMLMAAGTLSCAIAGWALQYVAPHSLFLLAAAGLALVIALTWLGTRLGTIVEHSDAGLSRRLS